MAIKEMARENLWNRHHKMLPNSEPRRDAKLSNSVIYLPLR